MLRERREAMGLTLSGPASHLRRSPSMLSRMEHAQVPIQRADLEDLLDLYGVEDHDVRRGFLDLHAQCSAPAWFDLYADDVPEAVLDLVWLESMAERIDTYCAGAVDGLLQTAAYAAAVAEAEVDGPGPVHRRVEMLTLRQAVLSRAQAPPLTAVIEEAALQRPVGGPEVMVGQLRHLVRCADRPGVEVRVLPAGAGAHAALDGGFTLLHLPPPLDEVASAPSALGLAHVGRPHTTRLGAAYDRLRATALDPGASADLITEIADRLEKT
jgi:hypothetical protein